MRAPALGIAWAIWRQHRWGLLLSAAFLASLAVAAQSLPAEEARKLAPWMTLSVFIMLYLASVFSYPDGDASGRQSGFPAHQFAFPVRTWALVLPPMLLGTLTVAGFWTVLSVWVLPRLGAGSGLWWYAAMLAAMLASLQALYWSPMGLPYLRIVAALLLLPGIPVWGASLAHGGATAGALAAVFGGVTAVAYLAAITGVSAARRGVDPDWSWTRPKPAPVSAAVPDRPFRSPMEAQLWFEWRCRGPQFPVAILTIALLFSLPFLWIRDIVPLEPNAPRSPLGSVELNVWLNMQQGILYWPVFLGALFGAGRWRTEARRRDPGLPPFLATRPLTDTQIVLARSAVVVRSALLAWVLLLLVVAGWLLVPARDGTQTGPALLLLLRYRTPVLWAVVAFVLAGLLLWTVKNQLQGMWADLSGQPWIAYAVPAIAHALLLAAFVVGLEWLGRARGMDPRWVPLPPTFPWMVGAVLAVKTLAGAWTAARLVRNRLAGPDMVLWGLALWVMVAGGLFGGLYWLTTCHFSTPTVETKLFEWYLPFLTGALPEGLRHPGYLAAMAVLFVPFSRLALAPLALHWNRHR